MEQLIAGVDLGGTKIQAAALRGGEIVGQGRTATPPDSADQVVAAIVASVREALRGAGDEALAAVGIGTPGAVDSASGTVSGAANVRAFGAKVPLGPLLSAALGGVEVVVDNDVRAAVTGEHVRGAGRPYNDLLGVFVGTGVGGGIVLDGRLRRGRGSAGEIGHTVVKPGGRRCGCGRRGCLEAYAGRGSIEAAARKRQARGEHTVLFEIMEHEGKDRVTSSVVAKALERGDAVTTRLIEQAVEALGVALASAQNLLDVEAIILGGGLGDRLGEPFRRRVEHAMAPHVFSPRPPVLLGTALGDLSGAVGAAVLAGG